MDAEKWGRPDNYFPRTESKIGGLFGIIGMEIPLFRGTFKGFMFPNLHVTSERSRESTEKLQTAYELVQTHE